MSEQEIVTHWQRLLEFAGIGLDESYVLSWHAEEESLFIDVDALLLEEHPFYERPRPAEKKCIRPAIIEFPFCEKLETTTQSNGKLKDVVKTLSLGAISDLYRLEDGRYRIEGAFGCTTITAERPILKLESP